MKPVKQDLTDVDVRPNAPVDQEQGRVTRLAAEGKPLRGRSESIDQYIHELDDIERKAVQDPESRQRPETPRNLADEPDGEPSGNPVAMAEINERLGRRDR